MGAKTYPSQGEEPQAATYWRRRFVALVIGLAVLAVIAWAFSGALGGATATANSAHGSSGTRVGHSGSGPAPGAAGPSSASGSASASASAAPSPSATSGPGRAGATTQAAAADSPAATRGSAGGPGYCPGKDVVLSLFPSQGSAGPRGVPQFDVDVVSTAAQTCKFNLGARYLTLVITSGKSRIWNSADCVQGQAWLVTDLQRGVPTVLPISWNGLLSTPGCAGRPSQVPAGTYSATATDGPLASNSETFRVR
jgi:hypothetical protein